MSRHPYDLPSLTTLAAFESAARNLSFKTAAAELNVTPGAVSHQIKALEADLGNLLFDRRHRGVALTEPGARLAAVLSRGFADISAVVRQIRTETDAGAVSVAATTAVSSLWLTPRITRFWRDHGDIAVNQTLSDAPARSADPCDLRIHYGRIDDPGLTQTELFRDTLVAVAHPDRARGLPDPSLTALAVQRLIHLESGNARWTTWRSWFDALGHPGPIAPGIRVNNYSIALQAAQDGAGVVLGWKRLIAPLLVRGTLVCLGDHSLIAPHGFHISARTGAALPAGAETLRRWLLDHV